MFNVQQRAALNSIDDWSQFPACVAVDNTAKGGPLPGITYGREASQGVEGLNGHIGPAREKDLVNSILWLCNKEVERFNEWYENVYADEQQECVNTNNAMERLEAIKEFPPNQSSVTWLGETEEKQSYLVQTKKNNENESFEVTLLVPDAGENGNTLFGDCTCGIPRRDYFPCCHMKAVARHTLKSVDLLVPFEFRTEHWQRLYPQDLVVNVPKLEHVLASEVPHDNLLRIPVTAPPKRGRPNKKRLLCGLEKAMKKARTGR